MHKKVILALAVLSVVAVAPLLSACHTTAGAGQDISATGQAIDKAAKKATPKWAATGWMLRRNRLCVASGMI